jgi:hypothetical protein
MGQPSSSQEETACYAAAYSIAGYHRRLYRSSLLGNPANAAKELQENYQRIHESSRYSADKKAILGRQSFQVVSRFHSGPRWCETTRKYQRSELPLGGENRQFRN